MTQTENGSWDQLQALKSTVGAAQLRDLLADDPERAQRMLVEGAGVTLDFSRQRVDSQVLKALLALVDERGVLQRRDAMFAGEKINVTEDRSVLHIALRLPREASLVVEGTDVVPEVHKVLDRMGAFSD